MKVTTHLPIRRKRNFVFFCIGLGILLVLAMILAIFSGSVSIPPDVVCKVLINRITGQKIFDPTWNTALETIIWTMRFPRVLMALMVGAGLSLCGILMQALTRNSLADPYILGISSGASAGAVAVIMYGWFSFMGQFHITFGAAIGAFLAIIIAMRVSSVNNHITSTQLVLAGIAVSTLFTALTNLMIYYKQTGDDKVKTAIYWMMGSLSGANWSGVLYVFIVFLICTVVLFFFADSLDVLMLGDDAATTLGVNLTRIKLSIIILCTILTGAIVSVSGVIGFVGLIIPHITRSLVGSKHSRLMPASVLLGGLFAILCDWISRIIVSPEELPIGVLTALFGAPFFLFLIRKSRSKFGGA
ncbi:FecCD family ABC transporter permease [Pseudoramibacter sp.]|uniref:FecCD family ABC transporter permease n=1 Tax=Pseudoramibacter sp. TaxID=2034862 RepID=UPI0025E77579|nr:iron ABC transporter permease [Pseudoramibacter sp.]MCH4072595.1 iron ABC transporter permease [Pseudoramibacter sp.]MCH4106366.1 iron ABC transporter permease [Pseudoramibacter sp.]